MSDRQQVTLDEALMWLNDRVGRPARVYLDVDAGEFTATVLAHEQGRLGHHVGENPALSSLAPRDDVAGLYRLGETAIDVTQLADSSISAYTPGDSEALAFELAENVVLTVVTWADDTR